jgi:hypothetical protein
MVKYIYKMKKAIYIICGVLGGIFSLIVISGIVRFVLTQNDTIVLGKNAPDVENMNYIVGSESFILKDGKAEKDYVKGGAVKNKLSVFGEPVYGDLDNDGDVDAATYLVNDAGGSGTFYYGVLVMNNKGSFAATNAMFLGDRIDNTTLRIDDGHAVFGFNTTAGLDNKAKIPFIKKTVWVNYDKAKNEIGEWVKDFEGESSSVVK